MREFKFRGKNTLTGKWVYGTGVQHLGGLFYINVGSPFGHMVFPESVGQFTGFKDKNGKEVYEGDIIKCEGFSFNPDNLGVVAWRNYICLKGSVEEGGYLAGWCIEERFGDTTLIAAPSAIPHGVVVGNIYDNFELLKGVTDEDD